MFHTVVKATSAVAKHDLQSALAESLDAYNRDVDETGFSPSQWVIGRRPRTQGDVLGGTFSSRLAEHGLMEHDEGFARRIAMRSCQSRHDQAALQSRNQKGRVGKASCVEHDDSHWRLGVLLESRSTTRLRTRLARGVCC